MEKMKRTIALVGALAMVFSFTPVSGYLPEASVVMEAKAEEYGDWEYEVLEDSTVEITEYYGEESEVEIPSEIDGKRVTSIGRYAFEGCSSLTSITIPDSVTSIRDGAFSGCSSLTSITIPDSVTSIGDDAFRGCSSLTSITIPDSVTSIGDWVFDDCSSLTSITIPDSVTSIGDRAFNGCSSLTSITILDGVTSIEDRAFEGCSSLTDITVNSNNTAYSSVEGNLYNKDKTELLQYAAGKTATSFIIPDGVTSIGRYAFEGCSSLTSITIPDGVTSIGWYAFYECSSLTSITIPDSVTSIGDGAFYGCSSLTSIIVNSNNTAYSSVEGNLYNKDKTELLQYAIGKVAISFVIPDSVTGIGSAAFLDCRNLTSITIPDSVTSIGGGAFNGCSSLTSITIPDSVTSIGDSAFGRCSSLTSIIIPDSVKSIGWYAFYGCSSLTSITIPDSVKSIEGYVFSSCSSLTSIIIPDSVTSIEGFAFDGCSRLTNVIIPDSVKSIGWCAFLGCSSLTSITIPRSVTEIGDSAFSSYWDDDAKKYINLPIIIKGYTGSYAETYAKKNGLSFTALDVKQSYTVTFNSNGGTAVSKKTVVSGQKAGQPAAPVRKGYTFAGWYKGNVKYSFNSPVTDNVTLTARWNPVSYKITYKTNGGTLSSRAVKNYDVTKAVSLLKPTRKGYIFAGWYTDSKFKNKATAIKKGTTGNKTLYAKWTKVSVKKTAVQNAVNVKGKKIRVTLKKVSGSKGYQIAYSTSKKFTKKTTKTKLVTKTGYTISKLKKGRTYYVRVRAYKTDSAGEKVYGKWSGAKQVTVRK